MGLSMEGASRLDIHRTGATSSTAALPSHHIETARNNIELINKKTEPKYFIPNVGIDPTEKIELYESNIDPILRFLHIKDIEPCSFLEIPTNTLVTNEYSYCKYEYHINWLEIKPRPDIKNISFPLRVLAFDLECNSSHGLFPLAKKDWNKVIKDIIKFNNKNEITKENLLDMFKAIPYNKYEVIEQVYIKQNYLDFYNKLDKTEIIYKIIKILYLSKKIIIAHKKNENIIITNQEIKEHLELDLNIEIDFKQFNELLVIFDKCYIKKLEKDLYMDKTQKYSLSYKSLKNPITYLEIYLLELFNDYFKKDKGQNIIEDITRVFI